MTTQLERREIDLSFRLASGAFAKGGNTVTLTGLRMSASISIPGGVSLTEMQLRVMGVPLDVMNRLTILGPKNFLAKDANYVTMTIDGAIAFEGTVMQSWIDANAAPDVALIVMANTGGLDKVTPAETSSYKGAVDVVSIVSDMASRLTTPLPVRNNGVTARLTNAYFSGALYDQIHDCARQGNFALTFDHDEIAIWPITGARRTTGTVISPDTGMVGYPIHTDSGISVQMLYNPALRFGDTINVVSSITQAGTNDTSGTWTIFNMRHELETETHNGNWFTSIDCNLFNRPAQ